MSGFLVIVTLLSHRALLTVPYGSFTVSQGSFGKLTEPAMHAHPPRVATVSPRVLTLALVAQVRALPDNKSERGQENE